jgi:hypothetical protein
MIAGSAMPSSAPQKNTPHWSKRTIRHQPRQRAMLSPSGANTLPVCASGTLRPPIAAGM